MDIWSLVKAIFSPWVILGSILVAAILACGTFAAALIFIPQPSAQTPAAVIVTVIHAPTATPILPTPTGTPPATPTSLVPPPPPAGSINVGNYVQISGTGGDGLRLRVDPDLASEVRFIGIEAEVFQVQDGPREVDGYTWWYLIAPYDDTRRGWAVANYLAVIANPQQNP